MNVFINRERRNGGSTQAFCDGYCFRREEFETEISEGYRTVHCDGVRENPALVASA